MADVNGPTAESHRATAQSLAAELGGELRDEWTPGLKAHSLTIAWQRGEAEHLLVFADGSVAFTLEASGAPGLRAVVRADGNEAKLEGDEAAARRWLDDATRAQLGALVALRRPGAVQIYLGPDGVTVTKEGLANEAEVRAFVDHALELAARWWAVGDVE